MQGVTLKRSHVHINICFIHCQFCQIPTAWGHRDGWGRYPKICTQPAVLWSFPMVSVTPFWTVDKYLWQIQHKPRKTISPSPQVLSCLPSSLLGLRQRPPPQFSVALKSFKKMPGHFTSTRSNIDAIYKDE